MDIDLWANFETSDTRINACECPVIPKFARSPIEIGEFRHGTLTRQLAARHLEIIGDPPLVERKIQHQIVSLKRCGMTRSSR